MNYDTNIVLLVISHDLINGDTYILNDKTELTCNLPTKKYEHTTDSKIFNHVSDLLLSYYDTNINWSKIKLIDVEAHAQGINIYYVTTFPYEHRNILKKGKFIPVELFDDSIVKRAKYII